MKNIRVKRVSAPRAISQRGLRRNRKILEFSSFPIKQEKKYMGWARVIKSRSESMDADVILDTGIRLNRVSVASRDWTGSNTSRGFGARDLPPKDALVLVLFPSGTVDDGLIVCSAYTLLGKHAEKWKADLLIADKEREVKKVMENGDVVTYDKDTGAVQIVINDVQIDITAAGAAKITVNTAEVELTAAGAVNIKAKTGQAINIDGGPNVVINSGTIGVNDFPNCPITGAPHCIAAQAIKVP